MGAAIGVVPQGSNIFQQQGVQTRDDLNQLDPESQLEAQNLNRRQQIANLLLQHGLQSPQGQMVGRFYVPPSWTQGLAQLGSGAIGAYLTHKFGQDQAQLGAKNQALLAEGVQKFAQGMQPPPSTPPMVPGPPTEAAPSNLEDIIADTKPAMAQPAVRQAPTGPSLMPAPPLASNPPPLPYQPPTMQPGEMQPGTVSPVQAASDKLGAVKQAYLQAVTQNPKLAPMLSPFVSQAQAEYEHATGREFQAGESKLNREARSQDAEAQAKALVANGLITKEAAEKLSRETQKQHDDRMAMEKERDRQNALNIKTMEVKAHVAAAEQGKTPPGYRATKEGNLQAIPGGPADLKQQGVLNQDTGMLQSSNASMDRLAASANELLNHPGIGGITGIRGAIPNIPGTPAADAAAKLATLKSQIGFGVLQEMRNNSKSGSSGLGAVSDAEGKRLESNLAALDQAQSEGQMKESLKKIIDYTDQAKGRLQDAYNLKHGNQTAPAAQAAPTAGPAKIASDADYNKLPSGTVFIGPDGKQRKKP